MKLENKEGLIDINNTFFLKIPKDTSMMSILDQIGNTPNFSEFCEDGFVYSPTGEKIKQWGGKLGGVRVNILKEKNLKYLANLYKKVSLRCEEEWQKTREIIKQIYDKGGIAHAKPCHKYEPILNKNPNEIDFWEYTVRKEPYFNYEMVYGFEWVKLPENSNEIKNLELGQMLYHRDKKVNTSWSNRKYKTLRSLIGSVLSFVRKMQQPENRNEIFILNVEDLEFVFVTEYIEYKNSYIWKILEEEPKTVKKVKYHKHS